MHNSTKHIELDHHYYMQEKHQNGSLQVGYIPSQAQQQDIFTKPLRTLAFIQNREAAGLKKLPAEIQNFAKLHSFVLQEQQ